MVPKAQKKTISIAIKVLRKIVKFIKPGLKEIEIAKEIKRLIKKFGGEKQAFRVIVASGRRSALVHGFATNKRIKKNEIIVIDFGVYYKGFCSDITRTFVLGKANSKMKKIHNLLLKSQKNALTSVCAGVKCKKIDQKARSLIKKSGLGRYFKHSLGHGIGRKVHQRPKIGPKNERYLNNGTVITIEPGIYMLTWGGMRIEDMVLVTKTGYKLLTKFSHKLEIK